MDEIIVEIPDSGAETAEGGHVCIVFDEESEQELTISKTLSAKLKTQRLNPLNFHTDGKAGPEMLQRTKLITQASWVVILCSDLFICDSLFHFQENLSIFTAVNKGLLNILYTIPPGMSTAIAKTFPYVRMEGNDNQWMEKVQHKLIHDPVTLGQSAFISLSNELDISHISPVSLKSLAHLVRRYICIGRQSRQEAASIVWMVKESGKRKLMAHMWGETSPVLKSKDNTVNFDNTQTNGDRIEILTDSTTITSNRFEELELDTKSSKLTTLIQVLLLLLILGYMGSLFTFYAISVGPFNDIEYNSTSVMLPQMTIADLSMEIFIFIYYIVWSFLRLSGKPRFMSIYQLAVNILSLILYVLISRGDIVIPNIEVYVFGGAVVELVRTSSLTFFLNLWEFETLRRQILVKTIIFLFSFPVFILQVNRTPWLLKERHVPGGTAFAFVSCRAIAFIPVFISFVDLQHFACRMLVRYRYVKDTLILSKFFSFFVFANLLFQCFLPLTVYMY